MSKLIKKSKGFTLLELMVVMALITVLMGMSFAAMTGVKGSAIESTAQSDANTAQKAVDKFNNQAIKYGTFPQYATMPTQPGLNYSAALSEPFQDKGGHPLPYTDPNSVVISRPTSASHTAINWNATVDVWLKDGRVEPQLFVPTYMQKQPESVVLMADETGKTTLNEFLWLLRTEGTSEQVSRKVEVYRLKEVSGAATYVQVY